MQQRTERVVIVGGGFGGLFTALELATFTHVTLIDPGENFVFSPMLYEYFSGELAAWQMAPKFTELLGETIEFIQQRVTGVDFEAKKLTLDSKTSVSYDVLVLAVGSAANFWNVPEAAKLSMPFRRLEDADKLRAHLTSALNDHSSGAAFGKASTCVSAVVVGGNASGVELAAKIAELLSTTIASRVVQVPVSTTIVEQAEQILPGADDHLREIAVKRLAQLGVSIKLRTKVTRVSESEVEVECDGSHEVLDASVTVWAAGTQPNDLTGSLKLAKDKKGLIKMRATLQVEGHDNVFAIGDMAACEAAEKSLEGTAQLAFQQAHCVAENIQSLLKDQPLVEPKFTDYGSSLSLGTTGGAVEVGGHVLSGTLGRLTRFALYLARLPTWHQRLRVAPNWVTGGSKPKSL